MVHILLKPGLENFEHYFTSVWDECNCVVVWAFFGPAFLWDWNENWPFPVLLPLLSFPNFLAYWVLFSYRQAKAERILHPQTSSSTNAKGSSLDRKHRKVVWTWTPKNKVNGNGIILVNNYLKCKWVECLNQKTRTSWMDTKTRSLYMLSTRDTPKNKWHI